MSQSTPASVTADIAAKRRFRLRGGLSLWVGGALVGIAVAVAITAPLIAITDPVMSANLMNAEIPPGWEFPFTKYFLEMCTTSRASLSQICGSTY